MAEPTRDSPLPEQRPRRRRKARRSPERAEFLDHFPQRAEIAPAVEAFVHGNYRQVRTLCQQVLASDADEQAKDAARELLRRIEPDRLVIGILWGSLALLVVISLWAFGHG